MASPERSRDDEPDARSGASVQPGRLRTFSALGNPNYRTGALARQFGAPAAIRIGALICLATVLAVALHARSGLR